VNKKISFTTTPSKMTLANTQDPRPTSSPQNAISGDFSLDASSNSPITRESNHTGTIFRFLVFLLAIGAVMYFLLHR